MLKYSSIQKAVLSLGFSFIFVIFVGSCATDDKTATENAAYEAWKEVAKRSPGAPQVFADLPPMPISKPEVSEFLISPSDPLPQIPVKDIDLAREAEISVLLRALADAADLNILVGNNVKGSIRVNLKKGVRWDRLFRAIIEANGLHYELNDDLLRIYAAEDIQKNIAMEEALQKQLAAANKREQAEPKQMRLLRIRYADVNSVANTVRETMLSVLGKEDTVDDQSESGATPPGPMQRNFMVKADSEAGQIILHGIPSDLAKAELLIQRLDQPSRQILIEASIVQANNEVARQLGVQWGVFDQSGSGSQIGSSARGNGIIEDTGFNSNFPAAFDPIESGFIFGAAKVRGTRVLQAQLSALQKNGRLNIISRPSITTIDQRPATIESGEERPFASAAGTGIGAVAQVQFREAVLRLEVTPHVIDENWVKLDVNTTKDDFDDTRSININGNIQVPILTRSAVTSLYLANGQTTVIGGLSSETKSKQRNGLPILKDIPGLGKMFESQNDRNGFSDTLIFITPHILPQKGASLRKGSK